jgi:hypothetical protein
MFSGDTVNISRDGLAIAFHEPEDTIRLVTSLLLTSQQAVGLQVELIPTGDRVRANGSVRWLGVGAGKVTEQMVNAGIFLAQMELTDRVKWEQFVQDTAGTMLFQRPALDIRRRAPY